MCFGHQRSLGQVQAYSWRRCPLGRSGLWVFVASGATNGRRLILSLRRPTKRFARGDGPRHTAPVGHHRGAIRTLAGQKLRQCGRTVTTGNLTTQEVALDLDDGPTGSVDLSGGAKRSTTSRTCSMRLLCDDDSKKKGGQAHLWANLRMRWRPGSMTTKETCNSCSAYSAKTRSGSAWTAFWVG